MVQADKVILISDEHLAILVLEVDGLEYSLELTQAWGRFVLAITETIHDKCGIVWLVTKVTSISIVAVLVQEAVVGPFPDEATLEAFVLAECVLVIIQTARAITHSVSVFAKNHGLLPLPILDPVDFNMSLESILIRIHVRVHISLLCFDVAFVVDKSVIDTSCILDHRDVVDTVEGLIAKRP